MQGSRRLRQKLAIASWSAPREGNLYGTIRVDATAILDWIARTREATGVEVTITHVVGAAVARALIVEPSLNGTIRFGRIVPFDKVNISFLVAMADGSDLANVRIDELDQRHPVDVAKELRVRTQLARSGRDNGWEKSKRIIDALPGPLLRRVVGLAGWLSGSLGVEMKPLGIERHAFGSAVITNVGMFGIEEAHIPPVPFARVPLWVLIGALRDVPAVVDGHITAIREFIVGVTADHRFIDGFQAGRLISTFNEILADPSSFGEPL